MEEVEVENVVCNLCGADDTRIIYSWGQSNVVACRMCGLIYKNPRLLMEVQLNRYAMDKPNGDEVLFNAMRQIFNEQLHKIESIVSKGRLLDVGCGYGYFMKIANERGWTVEGVDISGNRCRFARDVLGLNVFEGTAREAGFPDDYFDVVTMWDSLDYMYNPLGELLDVRRVLRSNGVFLARFRNAKFHVPIKRIARNLPVIAHTYSFSTRTTRLLLEKAGFRKIEVMNSKVTSDIPLSGFLNSIISVLNCTRMDHMVLTPSLLVYARQ